MVPQLLLLLLGLPFINTILTPADDPNSLPKYSLKFVTPSVFEQIVLSNESMTLSGNIIGLGSDTKCFIPEIVSQPKEINQTELRLELDKELAQGLQIISSELLDKCLHYPAGFWTYKLCYGKNMTQYNKPFEGESLRYVLSRFVEDDATDNTQLLYNEYGYYISEMVDSGDICDRTGYPRKVEFQYVCDLTVDSIQINWIKEVRICQYQAQVSVPQLCSFDLLSQMEKETSSNTIICARNDTKVQLDSVALIENYEPFFAGGGIYLLKPSPLTTNFTSQDNRTILVYADVLDTSSDDPLSKKSEKVFLDRIAKAFHNLLAQGHIVSPTETPYQYGDEFIWLSEVRNFKGDLLCVLRIHLDGTSKAHFDFVTASIMETLDSDNFQSYVQLAKDDSLNNPGNTISSLSHDRKDPKKSVSLIHTQQEDIEISSETSGDISSLLNGIQVGGMHKSDDVEAENRMSRKGQEESSQGTNDKTLKDDTDRTYEQHDREESQIDDDNFVVHDEL